MTNEERLSKLEGTVKGFNLTTNGTDQVSGGFGEFEQSRSVEERISHLEKLHDNFRIVGGDNVTVEGSLKSGYAICATCPEAQAGSVTPPPPAPPPECITHITIEACFQYGGEECYVDISETIEADINMECPLDLTTSGCKMTSNDFLLSSQIWVGCPDPGAESDITGAYFHFYPTCLFFDVATGWSFTPSIVFPNWPLTVLSSGVNLGFVDLVADGPFESDPGDGPCPCWSPGGGSIQCNHYTITFS